MTRLWGTAKIACVEKDDLHAFAFGTKRLGVVNALAFGARRIGGDAPPSIEETLRRFPFCKVFVAISLAP